jgi:hypothetical protein
MKTRLWVLIIVLVACLVTLSLYIGWQRTGIGGRVERQFRLRLEQYSGAQVAFEKFQIGLGYVEVQGLRLTDRDGRYVLSAERVRLSLSLMNQLLEGMGFDAGIREVFINRPQLEVNLDRLRGGDAGERGGLSKMTRFLPQRITISKGSIVITSSGGERFSQITALDGWLEEGQGTGGTFRCSGSWGAAGGNLIISGTYGGKFENYHIQGELREADLSQVLAPILSPRYSYHNGRVEMTLGVVKESVDECPHIDGRLSMEVDRLVDEKIGIALRDVRAKARLEGRDVVLEGGQAVALGGLVQAQGRIIDLLHPTTDLRVSLRDIDADALWSNILGENERPVLKGRANLEGRLTGPADDVRFEGRISAPSLNVSGHTLADLSGTIANRGSHIHIAELTARLPWAEVGCGGELDLSSSPPQVLIDWRLEDVDVAAATRNLSLAGIAGRGFVAGRITGSPPALRLQGGFQLQEVKGPWMPAGALAGCFHWNGRRLSYRVISPDGRIRLEGGADGLSVRARQEAILCLHHVPMKRLLRDLPGRYGGSTLDGQWIFFLSPSSVTSVGEMSLGPSEGHRGRFQTALTVSRPWDEARRIEAKVASRDLVVGGSPFELTLHAALDREGLWIRELRAGDELAACGKVGLEPEGVLQGQLVLSGLPVRRPLALLVPSLDEDMVAGLLSGSFRVDGTRDHPHLAGQLHLHNGRFGKLDQLVVNLPIRFEGGRVLLPDVEISAADHRLLTLEGSVEAAGNCHLQAYGQEVEAAWLTPMLPQKAGQVGGTLQTVCSLQGALSSPNLRALLRWQGGRLEGLKFDQLHAELERREGLWHLDRFTVDSWGRRHIWASGTAPGDVFGFVSGEAQAETETEELDLTIGADGDVISLLPVLTDLVDAAGGQGDVRFRMGGAPGSLVIGSGRCRFRDAWIEPAVFIERIEGLNGDMEIDEDAHFLRIEHLSGSVNGQPLRIENFQEASDAGLDPVTIPGLGLNLGVFALETGQDGIEVNVPGLMSRGETGQMRFSAHDRKGPLLLSGPLESPLVTGSLILNHLEFTYPPLSTSGETSFSFLSHVRWDLLVEAQKDVWYRNDYARLRLGETASRLYFTGCADEKNLTVVGHAEADRGEVVYLDRPFQVKELQVDFEGQSKPSLPQPDNRPFVSGRFETTVSDESTGVATDIYLTLYTVDPQTGEKVSRGQWGEFEMELSSSDPSDDDREKILAKLGYAGDYSEKALQLLQVTLGPKLNEVFLRPVIQPVERTIKRALGIDVVRLQTGLTWNILSQEQSPPGEYRSLSRRLVFPRTSLLVGKYLTDSCFLSYQGKFQTRTDEYLDDRLGISHRFGLEYRLSGRTILDVQYDYERDLTEGDKRVKATSDKRVQITHNFPF